MPNPHLYLTKQLWNLSKYNLRRLFLTNFSSISTNICEVLSVSSGSGSDDEKEELCDPNDNRPVSEAGPNNNGSVSTERWAPLPVRDFPEDYNPTEFPNGVFTPPPAVQLKAFRSLSPAEISNSEIGKCLQYKNPEYFSFHRYSFYDVFLDNCELSKNGPKNVEDHPDECQQSEENPTTDGSDDHIDPNSSKDLSSCLLVPPLSHWEMNT
ncbi:unnamed protein product [Hermetia illucens]|uniref:NADH dehydrogenase [ubiquinone] flavoprotein 3, mitochondrial n=1 Tax=Hermetia illucens TaxID=343691 RepID=A0A7R8UYR3_HERIL|nr:unnamed protein product [Hermetia illucens]